MSTRGVIAQRTGDGFTGVYQHSDSYPTWLGRELWASLQRRDAQTFIDAEITAHPGGWSQWPERCYCHTMNRNDPDMIETESTVDWLFSEWVYVIDPGARTFAVIAGMVRRPGTHIEEETSGGGRTYEFENYGCQLLGVFPLDGDEPLWDMLEHEGDIVRNQAEAVAAS